MTIESTISNLVKNQFPDFYHDEGPVFVAFVEKYFQWLETSATVANQTYADAKQNCKITVKAGNTEIVATSNTATFLSCFSNGDSIAIYNKADGTDYEIYTVNSVSNNFHLTLTTAPSFSLSNTRFSQVKTQKNPLQYMRNFYSDLDIDTTSEEFLVYFKEKYLKDIQFDTDVNIRRLVKHALDIYRSKGTERAADLLFKLVFGVGAKFYYPGDDLFRLSSGDYRIPRYLEVSLRESNKLLVNKQIFGYTSGATAFVEAVVRKTVKGRLIDVLYISAINGTFQTGELINSSDTVLTNSQRPKITGSLSNITFESNVGSGYTVGDLLDVHSSYGESAIARVANTSNSAGIVTISLNDGGYAYTVNAEVLVSNNMITLSNMSVPTSFESQTNEYADLKATLIQPYAYITYENAQTAFTTGDLVEFEYANTTNLGNGQVLAVSNTTANDGTLTVSIHSGTANSSAVIRITAGNTIANVVSANDSTSQAKIIGSAANLSLYITDLSGSFTTPELVTQYHPTSNAILATGYVRSYGNTTGSNGTLLLSNTHGVFRNGYLINAANGATANVLNQSVTFGIIDYLGGFLTTSNNYAYISNSVVNGEITFISSGSGLAVNFSNSLTYTENVSINTDWLIDYAQWELQFANLTGVVTASSNSTLTGTGTDFEAEVGTDLTGTVSVNTSANVVLGANTLFTTEVVAGDIISANNQYVRVREIVNNTFMYVNSAFGFTANSLTAKHNPYIVLVFGGTPEVHQVANVTNTTHLTLVTNTSFTGNADYVTLNWGFPGNAAANLSYGVLDDILSNTTITVGRVNQLTGINQGTGYDINPIIRIYEPLTYLRYESGEDELTLTDISGSFTDGELVEQSATSARGLVISSNSSYARVRRLRLEDSNNFIATSNSTTLIVGSSSGTTANVVSIMPYTNSQFLGLNANIASPVQSATGAISNVDIIVSGFGFKDGETVTIGNSSVYVEGRATVATAGKGAGYYYREGGVLSGNKYIFDGLYYQDFSYEIRSSVTLEKYEKMLKQLLHVAGTKYFGALVFDTEANTNLSIAYSSVTQS